MVDGHLQRLLGTSNTPRTMRGLVLWQWLAAIAGLVLCATALTIYFACPCERTPGGFLSGPQQDAAVSDWSFANDVGLCQLEVRGVLRHSINLNCMSSDGALFLSCSRCEGKYWSDLALASPVARIRIGGTVYPVSVNRVTEADTLDRAWRARAGKLAAMRGTNDAEVPPRPSHWWSFRISSRKT